VPNRGGNQNFSLCLLERIAESSCLIDAATSQTIPGPDIRRWIIGFAAGFRSAGLNVGDRIVIGCNLSPASTLAYLGAMYAGIVPILIEERLLGASAEQILAKSRAKAVWTEKKTERQSGDSLRIGGWLDPVSDESPPAAPCRESDLAALIPTSGSTGAPRLVMVTHGNLKSNTEAIARSQNLGSQEPGSAGLGTNERAMLIMPISYCFGASIVHTHLYQGGSVVFDSRFMFPDKVLHAINAHNCTTFAGVPVIYNVLLRRSNIRSISLPGLRRFLQAGGALTTENIEEMARLFPNVEFFVMYGQTEATARISCLPAGRLSDKLGSVGVPLDNLEVRIADECGRELPLGQTGEIQVRGPSVCAGYLDDPEANERKFKDGWLKTGDFAYRDNDGFLWITGRSDDFIKIRGVRVSVGEVEAKVAAMAGVSECAAVGVKHAEAGEALALLVVAENGAGKSPKNGHGENAYESGEHGLGEKVRRALPPHWTCVSVKIVAALPRTSNGKIARAELPALI
jgi:acyl-CoA synthetase (AMP-forming)/AMP-acid ligase II